MENPGADLFSSADVEAYADDLLLRDVGEWMDQFLPMTCDGPYTVAGEDADLRAHRRALLRRVAEMEGGNGGRNSHEYFSLAVMKGVNGRDWIGAGCCNVNDAYASAVEITVGGTRHYLKRIGSKNPRAKVTDQTWRQFFVSESRLAIGYDIRRLDLFPPVFRGRKADFLAMLPDACLTAAGRDIRDEYVWKVWGEE